MTMDVWFYMKVDILDETKIKAHKKALSVVFVALHKIAV